ncbi:MAG: hypothetical protein SGPRY_011046 [Prymnesium sp.]
MGAALLPLLLLARPPAAVEAELYLVGIPAGQPGSHLMGVYRMLAAPWINDHPTYARGEDAAMWFAGRAWCVDGREHMGHDSGVMMAVDPRRTPDGISRWSVYAGNADGNMQLSSTARCLSGEAGAAAAAMEAEELRQKLSALPRSVYLVATKMDKARRTFVGAYNQQRGGALVNQRPVYLREGSLLGGKQPTNSTKMIWQARPH